MKNFEKFSLLKRTSTSASGATEDNSDLKPIRKASWYVDGIKLPNIVDIKITPHGATFTIEAGLRQVEYK